MLEMSGVERAAGRFRLGPIDLEVGEGEYLAVVGPTGAGKSMLLGLAAGFSLASSGTIRIQGRDRTGDPPEERSIGYVHQDSLLFPNRTVRGNIEYPLASLPVRERRGRCEEVAAMLGIENLLDRMPANLSGGEAQRVALARALAPRPRLLLLDEPLGALDPATRRQMRGELRRLHREEKISALHVTHDFEEAASLADRIGVIIGGRLEQCGTVHEIFRRPASRAVAEFTDVHNVLTGSVCCEPDGLFFTCGGVRFEVAEADADGEAVYAVAPDSIVLASGAMETSARNRFRGRLVGLERGVHTVRAIVDIGIELEAIVTHRSADEYSLAVGREIHVLVKATAFHPLT